MIVAHEQPEVGLWYCDMDSRQQFEIVASDRPSATLELQYFTGEVEEIDLDTWYAMHVISIAPPKDWSGPYEVEKEQFSELGDDIYHPINWSDPLVPFED